MSIVFHSEFKNGGWLEFPDGSTLMVTEWNGEHYKEGRPILRYEDEGIDFTVFEENSPEWDRMMEIVAFDATTKDLVDRFGRPVEPNEWIL